MLVHKLMLGALVLGSVITGGVAIDAASAPDASAAACWGQITQTKGKNYTGCGNAQHFNRLSNGKMFYGNRAGANAWSTEAACYTNIAQYGMVRA